MEARAKSEAARRRRRQSLAIAAALLLAVVIGAGGFALLDQGRRARRRALTADVEAALRKVSRLRAAGDLDAAVLAAATAERLEAVFLDPAADYAVAFAAAGLDLADPGVVERIRGSAIRPRLLEALHDAAAREPSRRASLLGIADAVDADSARTEIRRAFAAGDRPALLARAVGEPALDDAMTYDLLAAALSALGEPVPALQVLEAGWVRHPGAFRLHVRLARAFRTLDPPDWMRVAARDEAIRQANAEFDLFGR